MRSRQPTFELLSLLCMICVVCLGPIPLLRGHYWLWTVILDGGVRPELLKGRLSGCGGILPTPWLMPFRVFKKTQTNSGGLIAPEVLVDRVGTLRSAAQAAFDAGRLDAVCERIAALVAAIKARIAEVEKRLTCAVSTAASHL